MVIFKLIFFLGKSLIRRIYWLYRLVQIKGIEKSIIEYPIIIEGKGTITLGQSCSLNSKASLKVAHTATATFGNNCLLDKNVDIRIGSNASITTQNECKFGEGSRIFINNNWIFGNNVNIATNCAISSREEGLFGKLTMKNNSYIADNCIIDVSDDITIGNDVAIGPNCTFYTHDHEYHDLSLPAWNGQKTTGKINIGNKTWIGSNVTILPGVQIGEHVVVAAGSVVTKSIPDNTVWAGVPAKQIKSLT